MDDARDELLTSAEMARADRLAAGQGGETYPLMERAGLAVVLAARAMPGSDRVSILCGPGNNGGDGFVAARLLREHGTAVRLFMLGRREALQGDAAQAAARWDGPVIDASQFRADGLVIDALFGAGLRRDIAGDARTLIDRINGAGRPVLSVDVPSGVDADTGAVRGAAIQAARTVTFFRLKPAHLLYPGRALCGVVDLADIGIPASVLQEMEPRTWRNGPALWRAALHPPRVDGHKFDRGHVLVVGGPLTATGAARLAARAALRVGAGLVTVASPSEALPVNAAALEAVMVRRCDDPAEYEALLADRRRNALVLGPGLDPDAATRSFVELALRSRRAVVVDAGGLSAFAGMGDVLIDLMRSGEGGVVATPHEGEFARAFPGATGASKLERARAASRESGAVIVLKGADTVIAAPDGRAAINDNAPPTLATAGSGDVLSGLVGGLMAQGLAPFEAACAAVHIHGAAAAMFGPGLIAEDLPDLVPSVLRGLTDTALAS